MKVIVCGGRNLQPYKEITDWIEDNLKKLKATEVVSGMSKGADIIGVHVSESLGIPVKRFPADWKRYGKSAGYLRNNQMAIYSDACLVLPGGRGTADMKNKAVFNGLRVIVFNLT